MGSVGDGEGSGVAAASGAAFAGSDSCEIVSLGAAGGGTALGDKATGGAGSGLMGSAGVDAETTGSRGSGATAAFGPGGEATGGCGSAFAGSRGSGVEVVGAGLGDGADVDSVAATCRGADEEWLVNIALGASR